MLSEYSDNADTVNAEVLIQLAVTQHEYFPVYR